MITDRESPASTIGVVPRILGHATDLLFNGGSGEATGNHKARVVAARGPWRQHLADLLSGMNVVPGRVTSRRGGANTGAGVGAIYCSADDLGTSLRSTTVQKTMVRLRTDVEDSRHRRCPTSTDNQRGELAEPAHNDTTTSRRR